MKCLEKARIPFRFNGSFLNREDLIAAGESLAEAKNLYYEDLARVDFSRYNFAFPPYVPGKYNFNVGKDIAVAFMRENDGTPVLTIMGDWRTMSPRLSVFDYTEHGLITGVKIRNSTRSWPLSDPTDALKLSHLLGFSKRSTGKFKGSHLLEFTIEQNGRAVLRIYNDNTAVLSTGEVFVLRESTRPAIKEYTKTSKFPSWADRLITPE
jgi:hypothetical protein